MKKEEQSYVYLITDCHGHIKIGVADNIKNRMKELQTGNPYRLRIVQTFRLPNKNEAYELETELHKMFRDVQMYGEWFYAEKVIDYCRSHPGPNAISGIHFGIYDHDYSYVFGKDPEPIDIFDIEEISYSEYLKDSVKIYIESENYERT